MMTDFDASGHIAIIGASLGASLVASLVASGWAIVYGRAGHHVALFDRADGGAERAQTTIASPHARPGAPAG